MASSPPIPPPPLDLVAEAGRLLYGDRWMSDLARDLKVSVRAMQSWYAQPGSSSFRAMPAGVLDDVRALVVKRHSGLGVWLLEVADR